MTFRLGAAFAAVVFAVTSGITAMEVHQLAAHGSQPLAAPTAPPTPVASSPGGHTEHHRHAPDGGRSHHGHAMGASAPHASHHATDEATDGASQQHHPAPRSGHSGHTEHDSTECTCVGPCASGAPPTLGEPTFAEMWLAEPDHVQIVAQPVDPVHQDPRTYLLPFSTAPPASA